MPASRFTCPECDATIRLSPTAPAGKKVRCPECDALVRPPTDDDAPAPAARRSSRRDDGDYDRPRRSGSRGKKKAQESNAPLYIVGSVILALLVVGGVVGAVLITRDKNNETPVLANNSDAGAKARNPAGAPAGVPKAAAPPKATGPRVVGLNVGNEAPDIEAEDLDGETFKLSDYRGKVVMLDFWGDW